MDGSQKDQPLSNVSIAFCGLSCQACPIYLATRQTDRRTQARLRADIVRQCQEQYHLNFTLEDITDCDGCRTAGGRLFSACKSCPIRQCAIKKGLESCAYCSQYACASLEEFFKSDAEARTRLDEARRNLA